MDNNYDPDFTFDRMDVDCCDWEDFRSSNKLSDLTLSPSPDMFSPTFADDTIGYTASVANDVSSIRVTPTAVDRSATITVNDEDVRSRSASPPISLNPGSNIITVRVTATGHTGTTTKTYTLTVTRTAERTVDICNRTALVRFRILQQVQAADCAAVPVAQLADITRLDLSSYSSRGISVLKSGDFANLSNLEQLHLSNNRLARLPAGVFDGLSNLEQLYLPNNSLTSLPEGLFDGLSSLVFLGLRSNFLRMLPDNVFDGLSNLSSLDLNNNSLATLPAGVFDGLSNLGHLDLGNNSLATLPAGVFDGLSTLGRLDLYNNSLTTLPEDLFDGGLLSLEELNLNNNSLTSLPEDLFLFDRGLSNLERLELSNNSLTTLPAGAFDGLPNLEHLELSNNRLTTLPAGAFDGLSRLDELDLSNNSLTSLPAGVFDGLTIRYLYLNNNSLTSLPAGVFDGLTVFEDMILSNNSLTSLPAGVFDDLTFRRLWLGFNGSPIYARQHLDLSNNKLTTLPDDAFNSLSRLDELDLYNNSLTTLPAGVFDGLSVSSLNLNNNSLATLPAGVFDNLSVSSLSLGNNSLTSLPAGVFDGLSVSSLSLGNNSLTSLPAGVFDGLRVSHLYLSNNSLTTLPAGVFDGLTVSEDLILSNNSLATLPAGVFDGLAFRRLNLSNNSLNSLPAGVFDGLSVHSLNLSNNSLNSLPAGVFDGLSLFSNRNTKPDLDLSNNSLTTLPEDVFDGLSNLGSLHLYNNSLTSLPAGVFDGLTLRTLQLSNNSLTSLPARVFDGLTVLYLYLTNNSFEFGGLPVGVFDDIIHTLDWRSSRVDQNVRDAHFVCSHPAAEAITANAGTGDCLRVTSTQFFIALGDTVNICARTDAVKAALLEAVFAQETNQDCTTVPLFSLRGVTILDLRASDISALQPGDFANLPNLAELYLGNGLTTLRTVDGLSGHTQRSSHGIGRNHLTSLPEDVFDGLARLIRLDLTTNGLTTLPERVFSDLSNLEDLYLSDNDLTTLPEDVFDGLARLETLHLSGNSFQADDGLPAGVFDDIIDTLDEGEFQVDQNVRDAHFVCSRSDAEAISVGAGVSDCLLVTSITISGEGTGTVTKGGVLTATGMLSITNLDADGSTDFMPQTNKDGAYGLFSISAGGAWHYMLGGNAANDAAVATLTAGGTGTDTFSVATAADNGVTQDVTITVSTTPVASISTTNPDPLTTTELNGATLTVRLSNTQYVAADSLPANPFTLSPAVADAGVTVSAFTRHGNNIEATLTLAYGGSGIDADTDLFVTVASAAHTGAGNLTTGPVTIMFITKSNDASLSALTLSDVTLSPSFATDTTSYTGDVPGNVVDTTVAATTTDEGATVAVTPADADDTTDGHQVTLAVGPNPITVTVTAEDGTTVQSYTITVITKSNDASLSALTLSDVTLSPSFATGTTSYTGDVPGNVVDTTVAATTTDEGATVAVTPVDADGSTDGHQVTLAVGPNPITVTVTAEDGTTVQSYTITVITKSNDASLSALTLSDVTLSPSFATGTTSYTGDVPGNVVDTTVTATTTDEGATVAVTPVDADGSTDGHQVTLEVGPNPITVTVTAEDGTTVQSYTITVITKSNDASLSALTLSDVTLSPSFATDTTSYTGNVPGNVVDTTVAATTTDEGATVAVTPADADGSTDGHQVTLEVGPNPITVTVTAEDDTTVQSYTITVITKSNDASLSALTLSDVTLSPSFATGTTSYTGDVPGNVVDTTVAATTTDEGATVAVTPVDADGSTDGHQVTLAVGPNPITVTVTAEDGTTVQSYTITVITKSNDASLSALTLSDVTLSPSFATDTTSYTGDVPGNVVDTTVAATTTDEGATVAVTPADADGSTDGHQVTLAVGPNPITVTVTAEDGTTVQSYTITVTRAMPGFQDLNADGKTDQRDAQVLYYAFTLGDDTPAQTALLDRLTNGEREQMLQRAEEWQDPSWAGDLNRDLNNDGDIDRQDARILYYVHRFGELLAASPTLRRTLLGPMSDSSTPQQIMDRANALIDAPAVAADQ